MSSKIFHRKLESFLPTAITGYGSCLFDSNGKRYLDGSGGAAVSCLGHQNSKVIEALKDQADKLAYAHTGFFTNKPAEQLGKALIKIAPSEIGKVLFTSGGSEALESAVKLARQYFIDRKEPERHKIIARRQSYHGTTLGTLSIGGNQQRRSNFEPLLFSVGKISPCYAYRHKKTNEGIIDYGVRVADELEDMILSMEKETVAAFVAETVVGATLGAVSAVPGYFKRIREICDKYGVILILDEIMCGLGRTGSWFAFEQDNVVPDIVTLAKGLTAGYQPLGAVLVAEKIYQQIKSETGQFNHGFTFMGHPVACAAGVATMQVIDENGLLKEVERKGEILKNELVSRLASNPNVGDIRGKGLFQAVEFVSNPQTKQAIDPRFKFAEKLRNVAMNLGLICYPMSGTADGHSGDHVLLAPPFIISNSEIKEIIDILEKAIYLVTEELTAT
ncbi:MAG: aspartate aminotransferase family protein [Pseudomonadota bacterium]|nr:aspartate aminotransferase family protein [Pseudomonadota bacterium]